MTLFKKISMIFGMMLTVISSLSAVSIEEKNALMAFYENTNGDN